MLKTRAAFVHTSSRRYHAAQQRLRAVPVLPDGDVETFQRHAFQPEVPALLPRGTFSELPAIRKWFLTAPAGAAGLALNRSYLARFGATIVPLEISNQDHFSRIEQSLSFFLECVNASSSTYHTRPSRYFSGYVPGARAVRRTIQSNDFFSAAAIAPPTARVYLAQAPIDGLPQALKDDLAAPGLVLKAGMGDVYDSSVWLGQAPTYTPLHRDPNPNLFVQLAGKKVVRLFRPNAGKAIFAEVQEKIGGNASATMRGDEMMHGAEKKALEDEVWGDATSPQSAGWEAELESGDGLFIPKGWWHSVKGVGEGMTGSVNWWFR